MTPWRQWGVRQKDRPPLTISVTILLSAVAVWTTFAVVRALVRVASGTKYGPAFWPSIMLLALFDAWATWRAVRGWKSIAARRSR
jgi:hypothetical protein